MLMVDSSVWVDLLRDATGAKAARFRQVADKRDVVLSRLTEMELLQGARDEREWELLAGHLAGQEYLERVESTWREAARIYFELRRRGVTLRSTIDCCLAQTAVEHGALMLHRDRDFEHIARIRPLQQLRMEW